MRTGKVPVPIIEEWITMIEKDTKKCFKNINKEIEEWGV